LHGGREDAQTLHKIGNLLLFAGVITFPAYGELGDKITAKKQVFSNFKAVRQNVRQQDFVLHSAEMVVDHVKLQPWVYS